MTQKLYVLVDRETRMIKRHTSNGSMGVFSDENQLRKHAWRYDARADNTDVYIYGTTEKCADLEIGEPKKDGWDKYRT